MLLKVILCFAKVDQYNSIQFHESLFQSFNSTSGVLAINQVYLFERSIT